MHATWPSSAAVILDLARLARADHLSGSILMCPEAGCDPRDRQPELVGSAIGRVYRRA